MRVSGVVGFACRMQRWGWFWARPTWGDGRPGRVWKAHPYPRVRTLSRVWSVCPLFRGHSSPNPLGVGCVWRSRATSVGSAPRAPSIHMPTPTALSSSRYIHIQLHICKRNISLGNQNIPSLVMLHKHFNSWISIESHSCNFQELEMRLSNKFLRLFCWFLIVYMNCLINYKLKIDRNTYLNNFISKYMIQFINRINFTWTYLIVSTSS